MPKRFYALLFICTFTTNQFYGQKADTTTKLYENILKENTFWGIDRKRILSKFDSAIIIHYEGSVYQFLKTGSSLIIKQNITTQKISNGNRVLSTYKSSKNIFHANTPDSSLGYKLFNWLLSIDSSAYSMLLNRLNTTISSERLSPSDLYIESFKKGQYSFFNISRIIIDGYRVDSSYLRKLLLDFIKENGHWEVLGNLLRKGGLEVIESINIQVKPTSFQSGVNFIMFN